MRSQYAVDRNGKLSKHTLAIAIDGFL